MFPYVKKGTTVFPSYRLWNWILEWLIAYGYNVRGREFESFENILVQKKKKTWRYREYGGREVISLKPVESEKTLRHSNGKINLVSRYRTGPQMSSLGER